MAPGEVSPSGEDDASVDRALLSALFHHVDEAIVAIDADGVITWASPGITTLVGHDPQAVVGERIVDLLHPDEVDGILEAVTRWAGRRGSPRGEVHRVRGVDGKWVRVRYDTVTGPEVAALGEILITLRPGEGDDLGASIADLRARDAAGDRLVRLASAFLGGGPSTFAAALDAALVELAGLEWVTRLSVWRVEGDRFVRKAVWEAPTGVPGSSLPRWLPVDGSALLRRLANLEEVHIRSVEHLPDDWALDRETLAASGVRSALAVPMVADGRCEGYLAGEVTLDDAAFDASHMTTLRSAAAIITEAFARHDVEVELERRARQDPLTGLANRFAFDEDLAVALERVGRGVPGVAIALVDLDRFKVVNDALGHTEGDLLLAEVASRVHAACADGTRLARLGGDELLVLHDDVVDLEDALERTSALTSALAAPFDLGGRPWVLTASVGVAHTDDPAVTPVELLRRADVAMYRAKAAGGDRIETDDEQLRGAVAAQLRREAELRAAVQADELAVHHQGEWDLRDGSLIGAEALVRWDHPDDGLLTAAAFVPIAEESDLVLELGTCVLDRACAQLAAWRAAGLGDEFVLRINLSARQLRRDGLVEQVSDVLARHEVPAPSVCLELTESALLVDPEGAIELLHQLRDLGVGLAVDDFGTGYSSMVYLKRLPVTALKIDQSFVAGLGQDAGDLAIVRACVELGRSLGLEVTAEGVETEAQRDVLVELGCHRAQGFLLSRPEPAGALTERLGLG